MTYVIKIEGSDEVLHETEALKEAVDWVRDTTYDKLVNSPSLNLSDEELMNSIEDTFTEEAPWCVYLDETEVPLRYHIYKVENQISTIDRIKRDIQKMIEEGLFTQIEIDGKPGLKITELGLAILEGNDNSVRH